MWRSSEPRSSQNLEPWPFWLSEFQYLDWSILYASPLLADSLSELNDWNSSKIKIMIILLWSREPLPYVGQSLTYFQKISPLEIPYSWSYDNLINLVFGIVGKCGQVNAQRRSSDYNAFKFNFIFFYLFLSNINYSLHFICPFFLGQYGEIPSLSIG